MLAWLVIAWRMQELPAKVVAAAPKSDKPAQA
jgi:hypothetical protein